MGLTALAGALLLSLGPGGVLFCGAVSRKPLLFLICVASAAAFLLSLLLAALPWRAAHAAQGTAASLAPRVLLAVVLQEALLRPLCWRAHTRLVTALDDAARAQSLRPVSRLDALLIALAAGLGHGGAHAVFFGVSVLPLAASPAVLYLDACPQMSLTAATAACTLALLLLHTFGMVCSFHGLATRDTRFVALTPALHGAAALASLSSVAAGGCVATLTLLFMAAAVQLGAAGVALSRTLAATRNA